MASEYYTFHFLMHHRFDVINKDVTYSENGVNHKINLTLWDSAGSKLFDSIRPISYANVRGNVKIVKIEIVLSSNNSFSPYFTDRLFHCMLWDK